MGEEVWIEAREITCRFGEKVAVHRASLQLLSHEIHALVGENGAGKSTLLKVMAGAVTPIEGEVWIRGKKLSPITPAEAIRCGVGMVYQHFALVPSFTGIENLMLGAEPAHRWGWLLPEITRRKALEISESTGLHVRLDTPTTEMSVGERQRLEILRVLVRGAGALLLDEPTAVLTPAEAENLYELLKRIVRQGTAVAVVTHHLNEVVRYADKVTVLRRGEQVYHGNISGTSIQELTVRALGQIPRVDRPMESPYSTSTLFKVENLGTEDELTGINLTVKSGEILGIAGIDGNGQEALIEALAGLRPAQGVQRLCGCDLTGATPAERRAAGLEVVHGDRHRFGMLASATIHDNLVLGDLGEHEEEMVKRRLERSGVEPANPALQAGALSGGNQQKLVMERALDRTPRVLIAAYPTRGVDAAAAAQIQQRLVTAATNGTGVLLISGDWGELRAISHRLLVLRKGKIVAELAPDTSEQELGKAMLDGP